MSGNFRATWLRPGLCLGAVLFALTLGLPVQTRADAVSPLLEVGDHWKYNIQSTSPLGFTLSGSITMTISAEQNVTIASGTYESYKIQVISSGTVSGAVSGTWTNSGTTYARKSDLAGLKSNLNQVITIGITVSQFINSTFDSPDRTFDFPLSVGKTWAETTTSTTNFTQVLSTGQRTSYVTTNTNTTTYSVTGSQTLTLGAAGTFETLTIHRTSTSGSSGDDYYSAQAGNIVKSSGFDSSSGSQTNLDLTEVAAWPYKTSVSVSSSGRAYDVVVRTNVQATNVRQNSTAVTFDVSGSSGLTGSAKLALPRGLNSTRLKVYVDAGQSTVSSSSDSNSYYLTFGFTLSSHTITVVFGQTGLSLDPYVLVGLAAAAVAVAIISIFLVTRRRKPPAQPGPSPAEQGVPTPSPPGEPPPSQPGTP